MEKEKKTGKLLKSRSLETLIINKRQKEYLGLRPKTIGQYIFKNQSKSLFKMFPKKSLKEIKKIIGGIQMVSLEELKQIREKEAKAYGKYADKIIEKQKKLEIKQDIKRIRGAKLRARFGITKESVEKTGKFMGGLGSGLKKTVFGMGKVVKALGESAEEYQKQQDKRFKRR